MCIVLCNLKAKSLAGYNSHGMVLCAETPSRDKVELLVPPEGSQIGDIVTIKGYEMKPPAELNPKKNPWDKVVGDLKVDSEGIAKF